MNPVYQTILLTKRNSAAQNPAKFGMLAFEHLEYLYVTHMNSLSTDKTLCKESIKESFNNYISYVFDITEIKPPLSFINEPLFKKIKISSENCNNSVEENNLENQGSKFNLTIREFKPKIEKIVEVKTLKTLILKIMCNEDIELADLTSLNETKLINLRKIIFIKFKLIVEISLIKKMFEQIADTVG